MEIKARDALKSIGLNKNEIEIYLDLIKHCQSSALEISKRTGIHRSNTYDALRSLIEKGFISEIVNEKKKLFKALEPEKIKDYIKQKENEIEEIIPHLNQISCETEHEETINYSKGNFAVREALLDFLKIGKPINVFGASTKAYEVFGLGFLDEFHKERIKNKIFMKHIYHQDAADRVRKLNKMKYTEARIYPGEYNSTVSTNICGDTIILLLFSDPVSAIIIKSKEVARTYNNYFEVLWKYAWVDD